MASPNVFISIGTPLTKAQLEFKIALMNCVRAQGFEPRTVGEGDEDTDHPHIRPWDHAIGILKTCDGAIVAGYEKDAAPEIVRQQRSGVARSTSNVKLASVWIHAEAGAAYALGLPMLLLCEKDVRREGMLEQGVLGNVADIDVLPEQVSAAIFKSRMENWSKDVRAYAKTPRHISGVVFESISLAELWSLIVRLKVSTIAAVLGSVGALTAVAYFIGTWIGALHR